MTTEGRHLRLVTNEPTEHIVPPTEEIEWFQIPQTPTEAAALAALLPQESDAVIEFGFDKIATILENLRQVTNPPPTDWVNDLQQFPNWEALLSALNSTRNALEPISDHLDREIQQLQRQVVEAIAQLAQRSDFSPGANQNEAFVYLLRLLGMSREFFPIVEPFFRDKKNIPTNRKLPSTGLAEWIENQKINDRIGQVLAASQSLSELLHLLNFVPNQRVTSNLTADYSTTASLLSVQAFIIDEIQRVAPDFNSQSDLREKYTEVTKLSEGYSRPETSAIFPPHFGLFKTRDFLYQELLSEMDELEEDGIYACPQSPEECKTWVQLVWYAQNFIPEERSFVFTTSTPNETTNMEEIIRLNGGEIRDYIIHSPVESAKTYKLPKAEQIKYIKPADRVIVGIREKLQELLS